MAAALTEYDSNTEFIEDPRYGELIIEHYGWGYEEFIGSKSRVLETHPCSDAELGLKRTDSTLIYPIRESSMGEVKTWKKKFKCVDKEDFQIWGDYNSAAAQ